MKTLVAISSDATDQLVPYLTHEDFHVHIAARIALKELEISEIQSLIPKLRQLSEEIEDHHVSLNMETLLRQLEKKLAD